MQDARRVAIVTGASAGIGLETALGLAGRGLAVIGTMRDTSRSEELLVRAGAAGVDVEAAAADVTDQAASEALVDRVLERHGRIDLLINNAGRGVEGTLEQLSLEQLRQSLETNLIGAARMAKLVLPTMRAQGSGRIVSLSSIAGAVGQPFNDAYCASKFGLEGLMQALALTVAPLGIGVSVVEAGPVATEFFEQMERPDELADPSEADPYAELRGAMGRIQEAAFASAQPAEEAAAVVIEAALSEPWRFRWQTSRMASAIVGFSLADLDGSTAFERISAWLR
jgi:NAD(P)-dependent dehydrogenase (short-subunit alcohol dehydrogenase family)